MTNILAAKREQLFAAIVEEDADPSLATLRELARKLSLFVHIGSLAIKLSPERAVNRSLLIDPKGEIVARYDKIHMFDVDLGNGESYREFEQLSVRRDCGARRPALGPARPHRLLRHALSLALSRAGRSRRHHAGGPLRLHPADRRSGHWHVLMRARAIENGSYVFAAAQGGNHESGRATFGHSLIVDPWGRVLAEGGTEPGVVMAEIDPAEVAKARGRIPSLQHGRRFEIIEPLAEPTHLHMVRGRE